MALKIHLDVGLNFRAKNTQFWKFSTLEFFNFGLSRQKMSFNEIFLTNFRLFLDHFWTTFWFNFRPFLGKKIGKLKTFIAKSTFPCAKAIAWFSSFLLSKMEIILGKLQRPKRKWAFPYSLVHKLPRWVVKYSWAWRKFAQVVTLMQIICKPPKKGGNKKQTQRLLPNQT